MPRKFKRLPPDDIPEEERILRDPGDKKTQQKNLKEFNELFKGIKRKVK